MDNISFQGIRIPSSNIEDVRKVAQYLHRTGFTNLGYKKLYVSNNNESKINAMKKFRETHPFYPREFGAVIFPWSGEAYIVSSPYYEQFMLPVVKHILPEVNVNLLI